MIAKTATLPAPTKTKHPRIGFYIRISTDEDHQKYSLPAQTERLEAYCKAHYGDAWEKGKVYRDTESGTHMNRPGLEAMLFDAEAGRFDALLVFRVDRLSRKVHELARMVEELTRCGVALKSITEPFDTENAAGKMMLQMLGVFAEFEHATIVERTKVGMEKKAKDGRFVGHTVPYGYRLDEDKNLVIHEEEAVLVRKIFKMYTVGRDGAYSVGRALNEAGHRTRAGRKWTKQVVLNALQNPIYMGKLRWRQEIHDGNHEPIVPEETFEKVQKILEERAGESKGRQFSNGDDRLFTGVIRCGRCNAPMYGGGGADRKGVYIPYYVCSKRMRGLDCKQEYVRAEPLEEALIQDVKTILHDEDLLARVWEKANSQLSVEKPDLDAEVRKVEAEIADTRKRIDRYFAAFEEGRMKPETAEGKIEELKTRLDDLEVERQAIEDQRERLELPPLGKEFLRELMGRFDKVIDAGTAAQKKHLLHLLVQKVLLKGRETVEVWYRLPNPERFYTWQEWLPSMVVVRTKRVRGSPQSVSAQFT
ncbi:MAG: recombinase family protein [Candidatus Binatia bacterium]